MSQKYRKRPIEIEAVQLRWSTWSEVSRFVGDAISPAWHISPEEASDTCGEDGPDFLAFHVTTVHGEKAVVRHGDWVIPDLRPGTFYPCKPEVFAATYDLVTDPS